MSLIDYLATSPVAWIIIAGILGLLVGSFLNVVIYRLPIILEREWTEQCAELGDQASPPEAVFTLSRPRSACPHCGHAITALENIPVISYLFLAGKCKACRTPISIRYPIIEALSALMSVIIAWHFGFGWSAVGALLLSWALIALTFIDVDHQLLPDKITLPLIWLGLAFNLSGVYTDLHSSVIGAIAGYLSLWSIYHLFKLVTGKEGMGYGDFKLLAALGAWMGWQALPMIVLLSSFVGALIGITLVLLKQHQREIPIPFGPYLAIAGWIALVWGEIINSAYLHWSGLV
ncbi:MAG TPA: prepilin peptidase [Methylophaga aminisulfidivorans]|jgi:leader peptidase (prepilin peptidase)/N-methyltransferase|uniref:Prepilin leader peptidase/N-methyltransferase n=1 Tax=Methylophaga thalassica TaxID=40223 RepID=A0ABQ5TZ46_9GAMM|nr:MULTISPECIES: A24 family peptidase [Methylophaga]GLQ00980.1 type 4 prepilin-like proteins leader peptide-processing enzyme [Methylophaga thalassica]HIC47081.1 prepilin peptidase [Methylophaga sp.]HIM40149.1 prepilin peptidase [Methylophaga aminisulfidivorans]